ncbi:bacteriochlorophyll 4-vinyl reductase [Rhodobaculum claviforme]|uniref:Bacteriochlorophyll 4-vinyl reductase n=1 Tax=Rhodobaculum claviforme TaxID=1549854 RepID=A0A934WJ03_9RHOB|nr:bacteriochlorophyll 4-vinyl reductase [Rhodobaculum claviforme]MBK5927407.1 bacteriochlorophyll 4-vinyl reductase [Rhodobaculum claviforme]
MATANVGAGKIGPNAILQLLPVLEAEGGRALRDRMLAAAGLTAPPSDAGMMDEAPAAAMHQALRRELPDRAPELARAAGLATGDYILAHRIPKPAQALLRRLPVPVAAWLLARAIAQHSWTFAGSGRFEVLSTRPLAFRILDNPVVRGEHADHAICDWHCAVFERLFTTLVHPDYAVRETACCATGAPACVFEITRR